MEGTTQSVIGKHNNAGMKAQKTGAITFIILGVLFVIFAIYDVASVPGGMTIFAIMFSLGVAFGVAGILLLVFVNKRKMEKDTPVILLSQDNATLTLVLGKNKEQTINVADIRYIKFHARRSAQYLGIVTRYVTHEDGTLVFHMKDGKKYKVPYVDKAETVKKLIETEKKKVQ